MTDNKTHKPALIVAALLFPFVESWKYLTRRVYGGRGFTSALLRAVGVLAAIAGAIGCGHLLRSTQGLPVRYWLPGALLAAPVLYGYLIPALWIYFFRPVSEFGVALHRRFQYFASRHVGPLCRGLLKLSTAWLPYSAGPWQSLIEDRDSERNVVLHTIGAVVVLCLAGGSFYAASLVYHGIAAQIGVAFFGALLGGAAALLVLLIALALIQGLIEYGRAPFIGIAASVLILLVMLWRTVWLTGLQGPWNVLIPFIGYHLLTAYALPGSVRLFSNGFWRRVWRRLRDLMQQTYEGDRTLYAEFQHHVGALLLTAPMVCGALIIGDALALRRPLTLGLAMLTAYCAQVLTFRSLHRRSGTMLFSVIAALVAAGFGGSAYVRLSGFGATWGGIVTGVMVFLLMLAVIYPVFYLSVRTLFYRLGRWRLADWVGAIFARSSGAYQQHLVDADRRTRAAYLGDERSVTHARHFLHLMNVICAGGIGWWTHRVWPDYWLIALGLALLSYACIGRLLTFNARGLVLFAGAIGISAGIYLAVPVWAMGDALLIRVAALGTALFVSIAVVMVLLVPAYLMLRTVLLSWNEAWLGPSLQWLHSKVWWPCGWFGRRVSAALRELVKKLAPLFDRIGRALARIREAYERLLAQIRGRG